MRKLVLNVPLIRKADPYRTTEVVVEKVIRLPTQEFDLLQNHPLQDNPVIQSNIPYMWMDSKQAHCVLFLATDSGDGTLVESEGFGYARYSQYIPNARDGAILKKWTKKEREGIIKEKARRKKKWQERKVHDTVVYTLKNRKLPSKPHSLPRSSFFITTSKEFKADPDLRRMKNGVNGMTLIGKVAEWVYRFCFREAVQDKKESDAIAPLPANLIRRSGRSPALPYPPYEQSNYYYVQKQRFYSFVSVVSFSFVL